MYDIAAAYLAGAATFASGFLLGRSERRRFGRLLRLLREVGR